MRINKLVVKDINSLNRVEIDFDALGPGLIALAGDNGSGKTTTIDAIYASHHLDIPSYHGNLYDRAHGRSAGFELTATDGRPYRIIVNVDAVAKKKEQYLYDENGDPVNGRDGKLAPFTEAIEKRFGTPGLWKCVAFGGAADREGQFLNLGEAERKKRFAEMMDSEGNQEISKKAHDLVEATKEEAEEIGRKVSSLQEQILSLNDAIEKGMGLEERQAALQGQLEELRRAAAETQERLTQARADYARAEEAAKARLEKEEQLAGIREEHATAKAAAALLEESLAGDAGLEERQAALQGQLEELRRAAAETQERLTQARADYARAEEAAKARLEKEGALNAAQGDLTRAIARLNAAQVEYQMREKQLAGDIARDQAEHDNLELYEAAADKLQATEERIKVQNEAMVVGVKQIQEANTEHAAAVRLIERHKALVIQLDMLRKKTTLMGSAFCKGEGPYAACVFLTDAVEAKAQISELEEELEALPVPDLQALVKRIHDLTTKQDAVSRALTENQWQADVLRKDAAKVEGAKAAAERALRATALQEQASKDWEAKRQTMEEEIQQARGRADELGAAVQAMAEIKLGLIDAAVTAWEKEAKAKEGERQNVEMALQTFPGRIATRQAKEQRLQERMAELVILTDRMAALEVAIRGLLPAPLQDFAGAVRIIETRMTVINGDITDKSAEVEASRDAVAAHRNRMQTLKEIQAEHHELGEQLDALAADCRDWEVIEKGFGRNGIQALLLDWASPEISEKFTEILQACMGPRFEGRFVTQTPKADNSGMKEIYDLLVIDHERGREAWASEYSDGEKTFLAEAIALSMAIYTNNHSRFRFDTIFRDEAAGKLTAENKQRYVRMLKKARELGGFHQVVWICQDRDCWEQSDTVLWCADGKVEVRK